MKLLSASILTLTLALSAHAAPYYLTADMGPGSTNHWNNTALWFSTATGGANPASMSGNDFYLNGKAARTNSTAPNFSGAKLISDLDNGRIALQSDVTPQNLAQFDVLADSSLYVNNVVYSTLNITTLSLSSTLHLRANYSSGSGFLTLNLGTLSGTGTLMTGGGTGGSSNVAGSYNLSVSNSSAFTGTINHANGTLVFSSTTDLSKATISLDADNTATITLNADLSLAALTGQDFSNGFTSAANGSYSASELNTLLGKSMFSGSGLLTIVPEPATSLLLATSALLLIRRRPAV